jgi:hypothetical protein
MQMNFLDLNVTGNDGRLLQAGMLHCGLFGVAHHQEQLSMISYKALLV